MSAHCSDRSDAPHASVSSTNMLRVQSVPASTPSVKVLNTAGYNINPWDKALVTGLQLDLVFDHNPKSEQFSTFRSPAYCQFFTVHLTCL